MRNLGLNLLGPSCYSSLIEQINPTAGCLKLSISKALGIGIISASSIVKIPQIKNLLASRSARGVSFLAYVLETSALLVGLAYNTRMGFPLSTFGESALIAVQNVVIAVLVLRFGGWSDALVVGFLAVGAGVAWGLFSEVFVDVGMLARVMAGAGVVGVLSKVPQIWTVWKEGGTGQLSAFAVCFFFFFAFFFHALLLPFLVLSE